MKNSYLKWHFSYEPLLAVVDHKIEIFKLILMSRADRLQGEACASCPKLFRFSPFLLQL